MRLKTMVGLTSINPGLDNSFPRIKRKLFSYYLGSLRSLVIPLQKQQSFVQIRTIHVGNPPVRKKHYRIPQAYREKVLEEIEGLERDGIIEKSESEWASQLMVVTKKDGGIRLCVDNRKLNQVTKFHGYPMPRVEELLHEISNAQFITTLDLAKGYWQVPVSKEDMEKTAFVIPKGLYQFITMPFFEWCTSNVPTDDGLRIEGDRSVCWSLYGRHRYLQQYLQDHLTHLRDVFQRLEDAYLNVKMKKCVFGAVYCVYLGYRIGQGGVGPEESTIQANLDITQPKTKKDVRVFLVMTGYYRRFVRDYAIITEPLTELLKKNSPKYVQWDVRTEFAFQKLKQCWYPPH